MKEEKSGEKWKDEMRRKMRKVERGNEKKVKKSGKMKEEKSSEKWKDERREKLRKVER